MTTTHAFDREAVMAYVDGDLTGAAAADVKAHLETCAECRETATGIRLVGSRLQAWEVEAAPARVRAALTSASVITPQKEARRFWTWPVVAAACVIFLVGALYLGPAPLRYGSSARIEPSISGQPIPFVLADGAGAAANKSAQGQQGRRLLEEQERTDATLPAGPMIVRTVSLHLSADSLDNMRQAIEQSVAKHGGHVASLNAGGDSLTATIRVPAVKLDGLLAALRPLGKVRNEAMSTEDVTSGYQDLAIRIANSKREEQRLVQLLSARTGKLSEVLEVEQALARVRTEIERMEASLRSTKDRVELSTVELRVDRNYRAAVDIGSLPVRDRFRNAIVDGFRTAVSSLINAAIALIEVGPTVTIWVLLLAWPALYVFRRFSRRPTM